MTDRQALLQAILMTMGASHYVVQFECDEYISIVPCRLLLDPPVPSVGDKCRVEWSGDEYTAKILAMGDEQQARNTESEYLKALSHSSESEHQPPAKKPCLLKKKKTAASKPKNKSGQKNSKSNAAKAKKGKDIDFVLDLGSPAKKEKDDNQQKNNQSELGDQANQRNERELPQSKKQQTGLAQRSEQPQQQRSEEQQTVPAQRSEQPQQQRSEEQQTGPAQRREQPQQQRSEEQQTSPAQKSKQPPSMYPETYEQPHNYPESKQANQQVLIPLSFSSSSGDNSDEIYIPLPKR